MVNESVKAGEAVSPVWCMVGNIVEGRAYGPGGREWRRGTKQFRPGAKVYCFPQSIGYKQRLKVIGHHRKSNELITILIKFEWVVNRRAKLVYSPAIIRRFAGAWDGSEKSHRLAETLAGNEAAAWTKRDTYILCTTTILVALIGVLSGFAMGGIGGLILGGFIGIVGGLIASFFGVAVIRGLIENFRIKN